MNWLSAWRWLLDLGWLTVLVLLFRHFWQERKSLLKAHSWLKVKGHITHCEWTTIGHSAWPKIEYAYQINEQDLVGEHLFLDTAHNNPNSKYARQVAYKVAMAFKENEEIDIFYNPNHPEQSALDVTMPKKLDIILLLIGTLFCLHLGFMVLRLLP